MNNIIKTLTRTLAFVVFAHNAQAQEVWTLERCIRYAQETNLSIQEANVSTRSAKVAEVQARAARLPNLNASMSGGGQFGLTINPITNTYDNISVGFNSLGLNTGVILYNGGQIKNTITQSEYNVQAAKANAEQVANNLSLQIANAYLNILLSEEQLVNAKRRVTQSQQQLGNTDKLIAVGTLPAADRYSLVAQIARDEQQVVTVQNTLDLAYLNLKVLLQLEPDFNLNIEKPNLGVPVELAVENYVFKTIYNTALTTQPTIKAGDFNLKSAETGVKIAEAGLKPTLSMFGGMSTRYSTSSPFDDGYFRQLNQNFGQNIGLNLQIPIYQNGQTKAAIERAKLQILSAQIRNNQNRQQLKTDVQTAIANAKAARLQYDASQKSYDAFKIAYENMQKRHALGAVNALELTTSKNNLDIAENDLLVARYDYLFKLKIIDFYNGRKLVLD